METQEWQDLLIGTFGHNGTPGGKYLVGLAELEKHFGEATKRMFYGHDVISACFTDFLVDSLVMRVETANRFGWPKDENYSAFFALFVAAFRTRRASDILSATGYPLPGYAVQRTLKGQALCIGAIGNRVISVPEILGMRLQAGKAIMPRDAEEVSRNRKAAEDRAFRHMIGRNSGLPYPVNEELRVWTRLFHAEVHGAQFSFSEEFRRLHGKDAHFSIGPTYNESNVATFMNRAGEIGWMLTRCLPLLQAEVGEFGSEWLRRWSILNLCHEHYVMELDKLGKPIARAFKTMMQAKFAFDERSAYPISDVSLPSGAIRSTSS